MHCEALGGRRKETRRRKGAAQVGVCPEPSWLCPVLGQKSVSLVSCYRPCTQCRVGVPYSRQSALVVVTSNHQVTKPTHHPKLNEEPQCRANNANAATIPVRKPDSKTVRVNAPRYSLAVAVARAIALESDPEVALAAFGAAVRAALPEVQGVERRRMTVPTAQSQHPAIVAERRRVAAQ